tara:strand:- start:92 stop:463 length:372 start_codon:yes stop_codon:yes gene_type:complete
MGRAKRRYMHGMRRRRKKSPLKSDVVMADNLKDNVDLPTLDQINAQSSDSVSRGIAPNVANIKIVKPKSDIEKEWISKANAAKKAQEDQKKSIVYDKHAEDLKNMMQSNSLARLFTGIKVKKG